MADVEGISVFRSLGAFLAHAECVYLRKVKHSLDLEENPIFDDLKKHS
ncbi:MAG: hypothetical protein LBT59_07410 [Clostridiales bacterium]|nr:hypothetical protein [Clostridiales bacterium]